MPSEQNPVAVGSPREPPGAAVTFRDDFDRPDAPAIGNGWVDGSVFNPQTYAPLGVRSHGLHVAEPLAPPGPEKGIGCCWRDLGVVDVRATIAVPPQRGHFREATPLLHVTPGTRRHGLGAWLSTYHGRNDLGILFIGTIGNPVVEFEVLATSAYARDDHDHRLTIASDGGHVVCFFDDVPLPLRDLRDGTPIESVTVPSELRASTQHGLAVDCHLEPPGSMGEPVVDAVWFEAAR
jgi:hypothetical protein